MFFFSPKNNDECHQTDQIQPLRFTNIGRTNMGVGEVAEPLTGSEGLFTN